METPQHPRRRVRSSHDAPAQTADAESTTPEEIPAAQLPGDFAAGFVNIYDALTPRQISVITIGSAIGTNLMIGTGRALSMQGPAAATMSYAVVGFAFYLVLSALGEVAAWLPKPYTVADQALRYCDPALGFSLGWIYWLKYAIVTPNQLTAAAMLISYWLDAERVNPGIWITIFLLAITGLNYLHHDLPSHVEFYVSSFKLVVMFALMILSLVIALGGGPDQDRRGFRYWKDPGAFGDRHGHSVERFFLICGTMSSATFAYIGSERSSIMAQSPSVRKAVSRTVKHTFYRVLVVHLLGITLLGMLVPFDTISLAFYSKSSRGAAASPFVAALYLAGISVVPDMLNACILLFVLSMANYNLYLATTAMCDLSVKHRAPAFLSHTNRRGIPVYALGICASLATLAYLNVLQDSTMMFGYFVDTATMLGLLTWISILITHVSFVRARRAQGIPEGTLVYKARFGLPGTWLALGLCLFISATMIFNSFSLESGKWRFHYRSFLASYLGIPIYLLLFVGYKVAVKSKHVSPKEADLWTGKQNPDPRSEELEEIR